MHVVSVVVMQTLMYAVWEELGVSPNNKDHLHERAVLRIFGESTHMRWAAPEEGGAGSHIEEGAAHNNFMATKNDFIAVMCDTPWVNQLPRNLQDPMRLEGVTTTPSAAHSNT